jgi:hypothetical protein
MALGFATGFHVRSIAARGLKLQQNNYIKIPTMPLLSVNIGSLYVSTLTADTMSSI